MHHVKEKWNTHVFRGQSLVALLPWCENYKVPEQQREGIPGAAF